MAMAIAFCDFEYFKAARKAVLGRIPVPHVTIYITEGIEASPHLQLIIMLPEGGYGVPIITDCVIPVPS